MFKDISYKKKFYGVLILFAMLSIAAYKRSYSVAISAVKMYSEAKKDISNNLNVHEEIAMLTIDLNALDQVIGKKADHPEIVQNKILGFLNAQDYDITLANIDNIHISSDDYFTIYSNNISVKGTFNELLKTVYEFEKDFEYARIATMKFYVSKNRKTKRKELYNDIIFQNYEKK